MAYIPPPVSINVAKGANKGQIFTGTGPDAAAWKNLVLDGSLGTIPAGLSSLLKGLHDIGVDTSALSQWQKGLPLRAGGGWSVTYPASASFPSAGLTGGYVYPAAITAGDPIWDPDNRGTSGTLRYETGPGTPIYPAGSIAKVYRNDPGGNPVAPLQLSVLRNVAFGDRISGIVWSGSLAGYTYQGMQIIDSAGTLIDWDYQP